MDQLRRSDWLLCTQMLGMNMNVNVSVDANAARSNNERHGLGKVTYVQIDDLRPQESVARCLLQLGKLKGPNILPTYLRRMWPNVILNGMWTR